MSCPGGANDVFQEPAIFTENGIMEYKKKSIGLNHPVFDYEDFLGRIDGDVELLEEVIEIFLQDTPGLVAELFAGVKREDAVAVERTAHTLKGAFANISAKRLQVLSQYIQAALKENDTAGLETLISDFEENFKLLEQALRDCLVK